LDQDGWPYRAKKDFGDTESGEEATTQRSSTEELADSFFTSFVSVQPSGLVL